MRKIQISLPLLILLLILMMSYAAWLGYKSGSQRNIILNNMLGSAETEVSDTFEAGWQAARQAIIEAGLYPEIEYVDFLNGYIKNAMPEQITAIVDQTVNNVLDKPAPLIRRILITDQTKIIKIKAKDQAIIEAEAQAHEQALADFSSKQQAYEQALAEYELRIQTANDRGLDTSNIIRPGAPAYPIQPSIVEEEIITAKELPYLPLGSRISTRSDKNILKDKNVDVTEVRIEILNSPEQIPESIKKQIDFSQQQIKPAQQIDRQSETSESAADTTSLE